MATTPLFVPSTRFRDLFHLANPGFDIFDIRYANFVEQEISTEHAEALLAADDDGGDQAPAAIPSDVWRQFEAALGRGVVWLGSVILVHRSHAGNASGIDYRHLFSVDLVEDERIRLVVCASPSARQDDIVRGCSIMCRALQTSGTPNIVLVQRVTSGPAVLLCALPGPVLSRFLTKTASLEKFTARGCRFCETHIRGLGDAAAIRPNLEVSFIHTELTAQGQAALVTSMQQNRGPTVFHGRFEARLLADAIRGNTRLKRLIWVGLERSSHEDIATVVQSFAGDRGLEELKFDSIPLRDENWELLCQAFATHTKLLTLEFFFSAYRPLTESIVGLNETQLSEDTKLFRVQRIVELLQTNTVLTSVDLHFDHALIATEIEPRLRINRFRPKVKAITKAPYAWRRQLVGRAITAVSAQNPTLHFMLLVQNADVLVSHEAPCKRVRPRLDVASSDANKRACV